MIETPPPQRPQTQRRSMREAVLLTLLLFLFVCCGSQLGVSFIRPDLLPVGIDANSTADYSNWGYEQFAPLGFGAATAAARDAAFYVTPEVLTRIADARLEVQTQTAIALEPTNQVATLTEWAIIQTAVINTATTIASTTTAAQLATETSIAQTAVLTPTTITATLTLENSATPEASPSPVDISSTPQASSTSTATPTRAPSLTPLPSSTASATLLPSATGSRTPTQVAAVSTATPPPVVLPPQPSATIIPIPATATPVSPLPPTATFIVVPPPVGADIVASIRVDQAVAGLPILYTISCANFGPNTATNVSFSASVGGSPWSGIMSSVMTAGMQGQLSNGTGVPAVAGSTLAISLVCSAVENDPDLLDNIASAIVTIPLPAATATPTLTPEPGIPSNTPTATSTEAPTTLPSSTATGTETVTVTATDTVTSTATETTTATNTATETPIITNTATATATATATSTPLPSGSVIREIWVGIPGSLVSDLTAHSHYPDAPDVCLVLNDLETSFDYADDYGQRIRGFITPPVSGNYTFWIASDNGSEFYLSSDSSPSNLSLRASVPLDNDVLANQWTVFPEQESAPLPLLAGQPYYFEVLHKDGVGGDFVQVAWEGPGITQQVISGAYLSSFGLTCTPLAATATPTETLLPTSTPTDTPTATQSVTPTALPAGEALREVWLGIGGDFVADLVSNPRYPSSPDFCLAVSNLESPVNFGDDYGQRIRGYITPPVSGNYTFWIASDNGGEFYLSTDTSPANLVLLAAVPNNFSVNVGEYFMYPEQQSVAITLIAGQPYYFEVLQKEGLGGDFVQVAWEGPGITQQVISGAYLSSFGLTCTPVGATSTPTVTATETETATPSATLTETPPATSTASPTATPISGADWSIVNFTLNPSTPIAGNDFTFNIQCRNNGPDASAFEIVFEYPAGVSRSGIPGPASSSSPYGVIPAGQSRLWLSNNQMLPGTEGQVLTMTARCVAVGTTDPNAANNSADLPVIVAAPAATSTPTATATATQTPTPTALPTGGILREVWFALQGFGGLRMDDLTNDPRYPSAPNTCETLTSFETALFFGDHYGQRLRALLIPPATGNYTFWLTSDNVGQLFLSTDANPLNRTQIAGVFPFVNTPYSYTEFASQQSAPVFLQAGQPYYIEALHTDGTQTDFLQVAWEGPTIPVRETIAGTYLSTTGLTCNPTGLPTPTPIGTPYTPLVFNALCTQADATQVYDVFNPNGYAISFTYSYSTGTGNVDTPIVVNAGQRLEFTAVASIDGGVVITIPGQLLQYISDNGTLCESLTVTPTSTATATATATETATATATLSAVTTDLRADVMGIGVNPGNTISFLAVCLNESSETANGVIQRIFADGTEVQTYTPPGNSISGSSAFNNFYTTSVSFTPGAQVTIAIQCDTTTTDSNPLNNRTETLVFIPSATETATATPTATETPIGGFIRAINLGGPALVIDGNLWEGQDSPNYTFGLGDETDCFGSSLAPPTDSNREAMLRCVAWDGAGTLELTLTNLPNGSYDFYFNRWEDNFTETITHFVQGVPVTTLALPPGEWRRMGPYTVNVTDGTISFVSTGGHANISGVEVWAVGTGGAGSPTSTPTPTPTASATSLTGFVRAINFGGPALVIDGNLWEGQDSPNYFFGDFFDRTDCFPGPMTPLPDPNREAMLRCVAWNGTIFVLDITLTNLPNGSYDFYFNRWEDTFPETLTHYVQGSPVTTLTVPSSEWRRMGPYPVTVTNGTISFLTTGGNANISGVEVWAVGTGGAGSPTSTPTPTATPTPTPDGTATATPTPTATLAPGTARDVRLTSSCTPTNPVAGGAVSCSITLTHIGTQSIFSPQVSVTMPTAFNYSGTSQATNSGSISGYTFNGFNGNFTWRPSGQLFPGQFVTLTFDGGYIVPGTPVGTVVTITANSNQAGDPDLSNNNTSATMTVAAGAASATPTATPTPTATATLASGADADASLSFNASNPTPAQGSLLTLTAQLSNNGPADVTNAIIVLGAPPGTTLVSASNGYNFNTSTFTVPLLLDQETTGFQITVRVDAPPGTNTPASASVSTASNDPNSANNNPSIGFTVSAGASGSADLVLTDLGGTNTTPNAGSDVLFNLQYTNLGPDTASGTVIGLALPPGVTLVSYTVGAYNSLMNVLEEGEFVADSIDLEIVLNIAPGTNGQTLPLRFMLTSITPDLVTGNETIIYILNVQP